jgi:hypothetical protein
MYGSEQQKRSAAQFSCQPLSSSSEVTPVPWEGREDSSASKYPWDTNRKEPICLNHGKFGTVGPRRSPYKLAAEEIIGTIWSSAVDIQNTNFGEGSEGCSGEAR